jgi:hypothetical protein
MPNPARKLVDLAGEEVLPDGGQGDRLTTAG